MILGGFGGDDLYGNVGDNTVEGGTGEDLIDGKRSHDRLLGANASDLVMARDGLRDEVACGDGGDLVIADDGDKVIDCETVDRPRSRDAVLGGYALLSPLRPRRKGARVAQQQEAAVGLRLPQEAASTRWNSSSSWYGPSRFRSARRSRRKTEKCSSPPRVIAVEGGSTCRRRSAASRSTNEAADGPSRGYRLRESSQTADEGRLNGEQQRSRRARARKLRTREKGKGRVEVVGKYSTGASYGTDWLTEDRCDGTLAVFRGTVLVQDFGQKKKVVVRAGDSHLAKKR